MVASDNEPRITYPLFMLKMDPLRRYRTLKRAFDMLGKIHAHYLHASRWTIEKKTGEKLHWADSGVRVSQNPMDERLAIHEVFLNFGKAISRLNVLYTGTYVNNYGETYTIPRISSVTYFVQNCAVLHEALEEMMKNSLVEWEKAQHAANPDPDDTLDKVLDIVISGKDSSMTWQRVQALGFGQTIC